MQREARDTDRDTEPEPAAAPEHPTIKVALRPSVLARFYQVIKPTAINCRFLFGGATAWFEWPTPGDDLERILCEHSLTGLILRSHTPPVLIGDFQGRTFFDRIKNTLDPGQKFPPIQFESGPEYSTRSS